MYGTQQFNFGGQQRPPTPQQYATYGGYSYVPAQTTGTFDMNSMMNMIMMIMMLSMVMGMMKPLVKGSSA